MKESWLIRIDCDPPVRMVATINNRVIPADAIESDANALYLAGANLVQVPDLEAMINDIADRIEIGISGVSAEAMAIAQTEADDVKGSAFHIGRVEFDDAWQITAVVWLRTYRVDKISVGRKSAQVGQSPSRSITLSLGTGNTGRSNAPNAFFTSADQLRRSSDDSIFDHVAGMQVQISRRFGIKS